MTQANHAPDAIIVIFGAAVRPDGHPSGTLRHRVRAAACFAERFRAPLFIPTGARGRYGEAEARVMAELLRRAGAEPSRIIQEDTGVDTLSSVLAVRRIIRARGLSAPVYAATSAYHLPRCVLLLRLAGIAARAAEPPPQPAARASAQRWYWRLREVPAIPYDALLMIWHRLRGAT
jgi:uncharacterized SAM-binding protein YcdF (DUF218 family)